MVYDTFVISSFDKFNSFWPPLKDIIEPSFLVASRECHLLSMLCDFGSDSPTAIPEAIPPDIIFQLSDSFFFACGILLVLSYII